MRNKRRTSQTPIQIVQPGYPSYAKALETRAIHSLKTKYKTNLAIQFSALTLVKITKCHVRGGLALTTVGGATVIMNIRVFLYNFRQKSFVDIARRKICLSVITRFVGIVELKFEDLG